MGRHRPRLTETVQGPPSTRSELVVGAQKLLEATAARVRNEVQCLDGDLVNEKLLLLQQLDHLDAALALLERLVPTSLGADTTMFSPEELCEACQHLKMAIHTMLALAPKFREAINSRLVRQLGSAFNSRFEWCSRRRPTVELSPEKRKSRMRLQLNKLEKQHETCLLDLLLTFEFFATSETLPPPDAPARCTEGARYVLAGQAKLHQSHAMLCQLLIEKDDVLLPILEWQLSSAASDFAVARAVADRLPRVSSGRRRNRIDSHSPPPATVGVRCESKARFIQSFLPGEPSIKRTDISAKSSENHSVPHLPRIPIATENRNKKNDCCSRHFPQEATHSPHCASNAQRSPGLKPDIACNLHNIPPSMGPSDFIPDLCALGPCNPCRRTSPITQKEDLERQRCSCDSPDHLTRKESRYDSRLGDYPSFASMVGSDHRAR